MKSKAVLLLLMLCCTSAQADMALKQRVQVLERKVRALSDLVVRMDSLQREVRHLRGQVEQQNHEMAQMKQRQRELYLDLDNRLSGGGGAGAPPDNPSIPLSPSTPPPPRQSGGSQSIGPSPLQASAMEERDYQSAFALLKQRRFDDARKQFIGFLEKYPAGPYADNAQYWLGEASYVTREFDTALKEFSQVLEVYPTSSKVPGATLKIGYIHYENNRREEARETLRGLIDNYPGSSSAQLAKAFMRRKGL
ncbi:MAG: tol-pal system protein YbgF [Gammaproteobacteria bacterium]|nr:tol-pal system protein YbgF [Gammaproteobacteria bacterium]